MSQFGAKPRFGASAERDSRHDLFKGYNSGGADMRRTLSASPNHLGGYGYGYPGGSTNGSAANGSYLAVENRGYRPATPNSRGQYSNAVLDELESQNDNKVEGILGKVRQLKDMTIAIGDEIRDSSALAEKMNGNFDKASLQLRRTFNSMMIMADRTGVGWRVWLGFFAAVILLFVYVYLF